MPELDEEPWLQLPGESDKQYQSFTTYLNMGRGRSLAAAYREVYGKQPDDTSVEAAKFFRDMAKQFSWAARCRAWDERVEREQREAELEAVRQEAVDRRKARLAAFRGALGAGQVILSKAKLNTIGERQARGLLAQAARLIDTGARGERLEMGEPDSVQRQEIVGGGGGPVQVEASGTVQVNAQTLAVQLTAALADLSPEERSERLRDIEMFVQLGRRVGGYLAPLGEATQDVPALDTETD